MMAEAWAAETIVPLSNNPHTTTKMPPSYDGRRRWFTYAADIDVWCGITELSPRKLGLALRKRLEGDAAVYKPRLAREALTQ